MLKKNRGASLCKELLAFVHIIWVDDLEMVKMLLTVDVVFKRDDLL